LLYVQTFHPFDELSFDELFDVEGWIGGLLGYGWPGRGAREIDLLSLLLKFAFAFHKVTGPFLHEGEGLLIALFGGLSERGEGGRLGLAEGLAYLLAAELHLTNNYKLTKNITQRLNFDISS
jgi:hypothetical protein